MKCPTLLRYESNSVISRSLGNLLHFHIITLQILSFKVPNIFQEPYNVNHFKVKKRLKSLQKAEAYLEPKWTSVRTLLWIYLTVYYFCNKSSIAETRLGYIQASENIEIFKAKLEHIIVIVTKHVVSCLSLNFRFN